MCTPVTPTLQFCTSAVVTTDYGKLKSGGLQWHVKIVFPTYNSKPLPDIHKNLIRNYVF